MCEPLAKELVSALFQGFDCILRYGERLGDHWHGVVVEAQSDYPCGLWRELVYCGRDYSCQLCADEQVVFALIAIGRGHIFDNPFAVYLHPRVVAQ